MAKGVCKKHGEFIGKVIKSSFRDLGPFCPDCQKEADKERKEEKRRAEAYKIERLIRDCEIPKRHQGCVFETYDPADKKSALALKISKKYADAFNERKEYGTSLVMCGLPGTGKTHLACAVANTLIRQSISVKYTTAFKIFHAVKATYNKNSDESEDYVIGQYLNPELLIIDEVGVQFGTDTEKIILYQVINGRYERVLPTIMISNLPEKELSDYIGERCLDRMREGGGAVISFDWDSYRKRVN